MVSRLIGCVVLVVLAARFVGDVQAYGIDRAVSRQIQVARDGAAELGQVLKQIQSKLNSPVK